ncbi:FAD-binding oxidoreductase [Sulfurisoma sediminicola]|uniref:FAD/FMN-containing dehydrogenase n=1 Tax=Sulfurisoma sediminicola TaxID=1381557 RepID=A0A497XI70_9PROT|nr:FAD-binding oxidoreductase [Sulfurisoma sediminicola]RLJ67551.1 FAD/FMN-containing dehydrogenase [Sulfurisoma sediminicola]
MDCWGNLPFPPPSRRRRLFDRAAPLPSSDLPLLAWGNGRSYGDVCINSGGELLQTRGLDRYLAFDAASGVLRAEAGVLLDDIIRVFLPRGWFLPVTPGTRFVTLGGALANDVHGKNHHVAGTFGRHVTRFELLRSDGSRRECSPDENAELYAATIGGLGLTGLVTWIELQLRRVPGPAIAVENRRFHGIDEFFALNAEAELTHEHVVAWIDCVASTPRGILMAGDHVDAAVAPGPTFAPTVPFTPPVSLINAASFAAFNAAYFNRPLPQCQTTHCLSYFYPLDNLLHWNRVYGRRGFYQYQCAVPKGVEREATAALLDAIRKSGQGSFLAVLKTFGDAASPGLLSYPLPGANLALDFPNGGAATLALFERLDAIVRDAGGRLYPAKDARMPGALFRAGFPRWQEFSQHVDPKFSSNFWRRISG